MVDFNKIRLKTRLFHRPATSVPTANPQPESQPPALPTIPTPDDNHAQEKATVPGTELKQPRDLQGESATAAPSSATCGRPALHRPPLPARSSSAVHQPTASPLSSPSTRSFSAHHAQSASLDSSARPTDVRTGDDKVPGRQVIGGGTSIQSVEQPTLGSSAWSFPDAAPAPAERPELVLVEPTPEDSTTNAPAPAVAVTKLEESSENTAAAVLPPRTEKMVDRKVWVKRAGASATLIQAKEDDLVDDLKETILRKYGNSLGKHYDAPDITLKLTPRGHSDDHILGPDEVAFRAIDKAFPGGQTVEEALIVHAPQRRTPRHSPGGHLVHHPQPSYHYHNDPHPYEPSADYFPPMPPVAVSPGYAGATSVPVPEPRALSVLTTGLVPPLISPGGTRRGHHHREQQQAQQAQHGHSRQHRPTFARQHTASPTALSGRSSRPRGDSVASASEGKMALPPGLPVLLPRPTLPLASVAGGVVAPQRVASPRPGKSRRKKAATAAAVKEESPPPTTTVDAPVPPINVLIVEDNMINMKLLEQFVRRLKVNWATAVNGREAVDKWRQGGFHLVLMDIQLPIMSGLDATKEIRRLERVNHIGVLSTSSHSIAAPPNPAETEPAEIPEEDRLVDAERLFKSPVIIVALTASNLQSDRHEALAAGCNDFLTKVHPSLCDTCL
jgi:osomolarity two-component system response regulator SSK1